MTSANFAKLASLVAFLVVLPVNGQPGDAWTITDRTLAPPAHASRQLAAIIAGAPQPDPDAGNRYPQTNAGWVELQQTARSGQSPLPALESALNLSIEQLQLSSATVYSITPSDIAREHRDHVFLHLHGGGYVLGGGPGAAVEAARISAVAGIRAVSVDYRMPPEAPFPAAIDDAVEAYRTLLEDYEASEIGIGGTSAGAGLAFATVLKMKILNLPLPGAIFAGTPWADLTDTSDSLHTNAGIDRILVSYDGLLRAGAELYADGQDLTNPLISPLYGDLSGFPPTILISGTRDMLLSDTARAHRKLLAAGVQAGLHVFEGMSHAEYMIMPDLPEGQTVLAEISTFLKNHLD
jgi:acetyl esterase/lipase